MNLSSLAASQIRQGLDTKDLRVMGLEFLLARGLELWLWYSRLRGSPRPFNVVPFWAWNGLCIASDSTHNGGESR